MFVKEKEKWASPDCLVPNSEDEADKSYSTPNSFFIAPFNTVGTHIYPVRDCHFTTTTPEMVRHAEEHSNIVQEHSMFMSDVEESEK